MAEKTDKMWLWVLLPIVGLIIIGFLAAKFNRVQSFTELDNHFKGGENAEVVLVEYADFQCSACLVYGRFISELNTIFGDSLKISFRHFPLVNIHPNAIPAARASEAADRQGKFWEMHDKLFEKQDEWSEAEEYFLIFRSYAEELGLDLDKFTEDYGSPETRDIIRKHEDSARVLQLRSAPSFILNGEKIKTPGSLDQFVSLVRVALGGGDISGNDADSAGVFDASNLLEIVPAVEVKTKSATEPVVVPVTDPIVEAVVE